MWPRTHRTSAARGRAVWPSASGSKPPDGSTPMVSSARTLPDRTFFECYPYTTLVGASEFGYDDKRPRYKRMGTALPIDARRPARALVCDDLIERMWRLTAAHSPAQSGLASTDRPARHRAIAAPRPGLQAPRRPHRRVDQRVDGVAVVAVRNLEKPGPRGRRFGVRRRAPSHDHRPGTARTASRSELRPAVRPELIRG